MVVKLTFLVAVVCAVIAFSAIFKFMDGRETTDLFLGLTFTLFSFACFNYIDKNKYNSGENLFSNHFDNNDRHKIDLLKRENNEYKREINELKKEFNELKKQRNLIANMSDPVIPAPSKATEVKQKCADAGKAVYDKVKHKYSAVRENIDTRVHPIIPPEPIDTKVNPIIPAELSPAEPIVQNVVPIIKDDANSALQFYQNYVVIDFTTTGPDISKHEIIEIGALRIENGIILDEFNELVRPQSPISPKSEKITGITNDMVKDCGSLEDIFPEFISFIDKSILVGHNLNFDMKFLKHEYMDIFSSEFDGEFVDIMRLSHIILKDLKSHKLSSLAEHFHIEHDNTYRAMPNCICAYNVYEYMGDYVRENNLTLINK